MASRCMAFPTARNKWRALAFTGRLYASVASGITSAKRVDTERMLDVQWSDGTTGRFPYVWLRDNCPAEHSYLITDSVKTRQLKFRDLDINVQPDQVKSNDEGVEIVWPGSKDAFYSSSWLQDRNLSNPKIHERRRAASLNEKITWNRKSIMNKLKPFNWNDMWTNDRVFYDVLYQLNVYGIVMLDHVPPQKGETLRLAREFGYMKPTNYGETFNVISMATPTSLAYTSIELGFHCDLPHTNLIPEVQGLHCIRATGETDGVTIFVDAFEAAKNMKDSHPEQYEMLCRTPLEFVDDMIYEDGNRYKQFGRHRVLNLDKDGNLEYVACSNLLRSWFLDLPAEEIKKQYEAMDTFQKYLEDEENFIGFRFEPGQFIIFDNLRVLHGRTAFQVNERTDRFLEGIYYSWDAIKSKIRCLHRRLNIQPELVTL